MKVQVEEIMTPLIVSINADAPLTAAARFMHSNDVGFLPVRDGGRLVGTVTDRDIAVRAAASGCDLSQTPVRDAMTQLVVTISRSARTLEALQVMERHGVSRLIVLDDDDRVSGVVSMHDIPRVVIE
jgi:CBS domain-containing protein